MAPNATSEKGVMAPQFAPGLKLVFEPNDPASAEAGRKAGSVACGPLQERTTNSTRRGRRSAGRHRCARLSKARRGVRTLCRSRHVTVGLSRTHARPGWLAPGTRPVLQATIQPTGRVRVCITCLGWCEVSELVTCQSGYDVAELVVRGEELLSGPARS